MSWTDERVDLLKKMWTEGKSASQIAKELGSVTRNAVIGKVHRLGLSSRGPEAAGEAAEAQVDAAPEAVAAQAPAAPEVAPVVASAPVEVVEAPVEAPAEDASAEDADEDEPEDEVRAVPRSGAVVLPIPGRRPVGVAGMPLPPQPSANEISPEALANVREVEKTARKLSLMELTERTCKWPIGDPATPDFWFCGLPTVAGKPYCEAHVSVAFQPMQSRRDRRR
jgi:GcrA cell cycle regulator